MADNLLSADELSALAEGVNDGTIAVDTGFNTAARVKKHDLAKKIADVMNTLLEKYEDFGGIEEINFTSFIVQ